MGLDEQSSPGDFGLKASREQVVDVNLESPEHELPVAEFLRQHTVHDNLQLISYPLIESTITLTHTGVLLEEGL